MMVFLIIAAVLIGLAYADFCLIDNTEHFGICFMKVAEAEEAAAEVRTEAVASLWNSLAQQAGGSPSPTAGVEATGEVDAASTADDLKSARLRPRPVPEPLLLLKSEPVLEFHEAS